MKMQNGVELVFTKDFCCGFHEAYCLEMLFHEAGVQVEKWPRGGVFSFVGCVGLLLVL